MAENLHVSDQERIETQLSELFPRLFKYALSLVKNKADAEDCAMEAIVSFLRIYRRDRIEPDNLEAYLIKSTRNKAMDLATRSSRHQLMDDFDGILEGDEQRSDTDPLLRKRIKESFSKLNARCREIIALSALGYAYLEISEIVSAPKNTVAGRLFKCRGDFRALLGEVD